MSPLDPTVSVVIPCYNAGAFVADAVAAVLAQTHPVHEIICVDDGSTDGTLEVLRRLQTESPIPFHVLAGPNGGASRARNRGTHAAAGEYIQYLDADDVLLPRKIEHQLALVRAAGGTPDLIAASYRHVRYGDGEQMGDLEVDDDVWRGLICARLGITSSNLWRRQAVIDAGGWNERLRTSEDPELMFRMLKSGSRVIIDAECLTVLRRREESLWSANPRASLEGWVRLRREILEHLRQKEGMSPERDRDLTARVFGRIRSLYRVNPALAVREHDAIIVYKPDPRQVRCTPLYWVVYDRFGFSAAERLAALLVRAKRMGRKARPRRRTAEAPSYGRLRALAGGGEGQTAVSDKSG